VSLAWSSSWLRCESCCADWSTCFIALSSSVSRRCPAIRRIRFRRAWPVPSTATSLRRVRKLLDKYADLPMDFADATLVALAEELDCTSVFTTDRTDFSVYRLKGRKPFRLMPND